MPIAINTDHLDASKLTDTTTEELVVKLTASIERMTKALPIFAYKLATANWLIHNDFGKYGPTTYTFPEAGDVGFHADYLAGLSESALDHLVYNKARKCLPPNKRIKIGALPPLSAARGWH